MSATILDGRAIAARIWEETRERAAALAASSGRAPRLAVVRVGDDPSSASYLRQIGRAFRGGGLELSERPLPEAIAQADLEAELDRLGADPATDGILLQAPLPKGLSLERAS